MKRCRLEPADLRWRCDPAVFDIRSTREVAARPGGIGQRKALARLKMGLSLDGPGYNLFLCGLSGPRKSQEVLDLVRARAPARSSVPDRCFVHNFEDPRRPRLLELPAGKGEKLQRAVATTLSSLQLQLDKLPERHWKSRASKIIDERLAKIVERIDDERLEAWLATWKTQFLRHIRSLALEDYEVNCLGQPARSRGPRVLSETLPTHANLFGWIGRRSIQDGPSAPHFSEIRRGSFLEADGGILVIDASDLLASPGSWVTLKNNLKSGTFECLDGDPSSGSRTGSLKPEPIPTNVKVVLFGDYGLYDYLYDADSEFSEVFKFRVDFPSDTNLSKTVLRKSYPNLVASICESSELRPVAAAGLARVAEYGVRKAGRKNKIITQSSVIEDLLREADYWAGSASRRTITAADVDRAIVEAIDRVNLVEKRIAEMIHDGTILISTRGSRVGQVNGLAIYDMGDYFFGKPSRITAETSVGYGGIINIERESGFSGRSHDKGVQILAGYLRSCFAQNRPLSLTASVCFEQSYSGIDGDSASTTEIYAILSSLSGLPIRQDVAVTGSVSQKGDIQPIGGVNEKIEGFFDCVQALRPTGREGVIIPRKNVSDLMLRPDVVRAVDKGRFHIYAIDCVSEGVEILTGVSAGRRQKDGSYPEGSVFHRVDRRLEELAEHLLRYQDRNGGPQPRTPRGPLGDSDD